MPPTVSMDFKKDVKTLSLFLKKVESDSLVFYSILSFMKFHPDINEVLFDYSQSAASLKRTDILNTIMRPFLVSIHRFNYKATLTFNICSKTKRKPTNYPEVVITWLLVFCS